MGRAEAAARLVWRAAPSPRRGQEASETGHASPFASLRALRLERSSPPPPAHFVLVETRRGDPQRRFLSRIDRDGYERVSDPAGAWRFRTRKDAVRAIGATRFFARGWIGAVADPLLANNQGPGNVTEAAP